MPDYSNTISHLSVNMLAVLHVLIDKKLCTEEEMLEAQKIAEAHLDAEVQKQIEAWRERVAARK